MSDKPVGRTPIPEEIFRKAWLWLLEKHHPDQISATKLQKSVGGSYHRSVELLAKFKQEWQSEYPAQIPIVESQSEKLPWFQESLDQLVSEYKKLMVKQFEDFSPLVEDKVLTAASKLEEEQLGLEFAVKEKQEELDRLDAQLPGLKDQIAKYDHILSVKDQTIEKLQEQKRQDRAMINRRENERDRAQELLKERQEALLKSEREYMDAREERDTLRGKLSASNEYLKTASESYNQSLEKLDSELESAKLAKEKQIFENSSLLTKNQHLQEQIDLLTCENKQLINDLGDANGQLKQLLGSEKREAAKKTEKTEK